VPEPRTTHRFFRHWRLWLLTAGALAASPWAVAQPAGDTITFIVPYVPGGSADRVGRVAAESLAEILGIKVVVSNVPGSGGVTGTAAIASQKADGKTLGLGISTSMIGAQLFSPTATYNPTEDFEWLAILGTYPNAMVVSGKRPERSLDELLATARTSATPLRYASFGVGTAGHLAGSFLRLEQRANLEHQVIERAEDGYAMLASGQLDFFFDGVPNAGEAAPRSGHRIVAVTSSTRIPSLPDAPAFGERWPGESFVVWVGVVAPRGLPPDVFSRLAGAIGVLVLEPRHAEALRATGLTYAGLSGARAKEYIEDEIVRTARLIGRMRGEISRRPGT